MEAADYVIVATAAARCEAAWIDACTYADPLDVAVAVFAGKAVAGFARYELTLTVPGWNPRDAIETALQLFDAFAEDIPALPRWPLESLYIEGVRAADGAVNPLPATHAP